MEGSSETKVTSEENNKVGSTFEGNFTYSGKTYKISYEVVDFTSPSNFRVKSSDVPFPFESWLDPRCLEGEIEISNTNKAGSDHIITSIKFILLKPLLRLR